MNDKYFKKYHKYKMKYIIQKGGDLENMIDYLICPITKDIMIDPVIATDGHAYDRIAISEWLEVSNTSPVTRQVLENDTLIPNINLKQMSENLLEFIKIKNDSSPELKKQQEKLIQKINALRDFEMTPIRKFDLLLKNNPQEILAEAFKYISKGNDSKLMSDELKWNKTTEWLGTREQSWYRIFPKNQLKEILNQIISRRSEEYPHGRVGPDFFNNSTYLNIRKYMEEPKNDRTEKYILYDIGFYIIDNTFDGKPSKPWLNYVYGTSNSYSSSEGLPQVVLKGLLYLIKNTGSSISLDIKYNKSSDVQDTEINKLGIVSSKLWGLVPGI